MIPYLRTARLSSVQQNLFGPAGNLKSGSPRGAGLKRPRSDFSKMICRHRAREGMRRRAADTLFSTAPLHGCETMRRSICRAGGRGADCQFAAGAVEALENFSHGNGAGYLAGNAKGVAGSCRGRCCEGRRAIEVKLSDAFEWAAYWRLPDSCTAGRGANFICLMEIWGVNDTIAGAIAHWGNSPRRASCGLSPRICLAAGARRRAQRP